MGEGGGEHLNTEQKASSTPHLQLHPLLTCTQHYVCSLPQAHPVDTMATIRIKSVDKDGVVVWRCIENCTKNKILFKKEKQREGVGRWMEREWAPLLQLYKYMCMRCLQANGGNCNHIQRLTYHILHRARQRSSGRTGHEYRLIKIQRYNENHTSESKTANFTVFQMEVGRGVFLSLVLIRIVGGVD